APRSPRTGGWARSSRDCALRTCPLVASGPATCSTSMRCGTGATRPGGSSPRWTTGRLCTPPDEEVNHAGPVHPGGAASTAPTVVPVVVGGQAAADHVDSGIRGRGAAVRPHPGVRGAARPARPEPADLPDPPDRQRPGRHRDPWYPHGGARTVRADLPGGP